MNKAAKFAVVLVLVIAAAVAGFAVLLHGHTVAVLNPKGQVAAKELHLMITATMLMLIVVVPVFVLTFWISWKFRASNTQAVYTPDWDHNRLIETIWWGVPTLLILALSVITWQSSHELDPFKPLASTQPPLTIQVVALQWKWLFIYPEQHIATVNYVQFPVNTPVNFVITSDAPMNSFWIPQLGGQIYAMSGMSTRISLLADQSGTYQGSSANLSGHGFAGMKFAATAQPTADFDSWVDSIKRAPNTLSSSQYAQLAKPSSNNPMAAYSHPGEGLYDDIVMKYMSPTNAPANSPLGAMSL